MLDVIDREPVNGFKRIVTALFILFGVVKFVQKPSPVLKIRGIGRSGENHHVADGDCKTLPKGAVTSIEEPRYGEIWYVPDRNSSRQEHV